MTRTWFAVAAAGASLLAAGGRAQAQGAGGAGSDPSMQGQALPSQMSQMSDEPKKHLSEIDVYLQNAINNVKVLYETTQLRPGSLDVTIAKEGVGNTDKAISGALMHIAHIKALPEAKAQDMNKLNQLQRSFTEARSTLYKLRSAARSDSRPQIQSFASQLYAQLRLAEDSFSSIAREQRVVRVDQISVPERVPVGGSSGSGSPSDSQFQPPSSPGSPAQPPMQPPSPPSESESGSTGKQY